MRLCGQLSWASISFDDRDLIVPKSARSTNFRAGGRTAWRALRREACGASLAPEFVGSVALLRSGGGRLYSFPACGGARRAALRAHQSRRL